MMIPKRAFLYAVFLLPFVSAAQAVEDTGEEFFERRIRPLLADNCYSCHSTRAKKLKGNLFLDHKAGVLEGGANGPAIVPGNPDESLLIQAVRREHKDFKMPPKDPLSGEQVKLLEKWVAMGAPDPRTEVPAEAANWANGFNWTEEAKHWSYQPISDPEPPEVESGDWAANDIDRFVLARMEENDLSPVGDVDRVTWIRRATYDLLGLPPKPEDIRNFVDDPAPDAEAKAKVVDRLLASPAYGEKWGRYWLDLVRYADTSGCNADTPIPSMYKYRDYVIESFNEDKPFDRFITEQIAGDLLDHETEDERYENLVATGYLALARRFGSRRQNPEQVVEDMIKNLGKGMLGMTMGCARCHDHKYDPVTMEDYYSLYGIFDSTTLAYPGTEIFQPPAHLYIMGDSEDDEKLREYQAKINDTWRREWFARKAQREHPWRIRQLEQKEDRTPEEDKMLERLREEHRNINRRALEDEFTKLQREYPEVDADTIFGAKEREPGEGYTEMGDAYIQKRGERFNRGETVRRGFPRILGGQKLPEDYEGSGRLKLAEWITDSRNPLTARVFVNRVWQHHFGKGIVTTPNDFGSRGAPPSHPELLDYLATRFVESGWSLKALHRDIMLTRTYGLATSNDERNALKDVTNTYLWRFDRRRLTAEEIRDSILTLSGSIEEGPAGPQPFKDVEDWRYTQHTPFQDSFDTKHRAVYMLQPRIRKETYMAIFDGPDNNATTAQRASTHSPLQALFFMNSDLIHGETEKLAARLVERHDSPTERIDRLHWLIVGRGATHEEMDMGLKYLSKATGLMLAREVPAEKHETLALAGLARVMFGSNAFIFVE